MGHNNGNASQSWVKLNVGGKIFLTTKQTLTKEPDSFLSRLVLEDPDLPTDKVRCLALMSEAKPTYLLIFTPCQRQGVVCVSVCGSVCGPLDLLSSKDMKTLRETKCQIFMDVYEQDISTCT